jgi:hypothetical protein
MYLEPHRLATSILRAGVLAGLVGVLAASGSTTLAQNTEDTEAVAYQDGTYGRVRSYEGGLAIVRAADDGDTRAGLNSPVFPGDRVVTDYGQRTEIQLAAGTLVRVDMGTSVTFLAMPDPYAEVLDNTVLQVGEGKIRVDARLTDEEEFRIDTPSASIYLLGNGDYRIEVNAAGRTRVISRRGVAEVVGQGGSVLVRGGTLSDAHPDTLPDTPQPFNTFVSDDFDRWFDEREAAYRPRDRYVDSGTYEALPEEVQPYYGELSGSGNWVDTEEYGTIWYPEQRPPGWRPYHDGYWNYGPDGYFWVSYEPWGWAPYHYGRWSWAVDHGWFWSPGRSFAGSWVAWSWGSSYVGWCALDYWNRPAYMHTIYYGYYDPYAWNLVHYDHFHHHHYDHYYVDVHDVGDPLRNSAVVTRPVQTSPTALAKNPDLRKQAHKNARADASTQLKPLAQDTRPVTNFKRQDADRVGKPRAIAGRPAVGQGSKTSSTVAPTFKRELTRGTAARRPTGSTTFSGSGPGASTRDPRDMYKRFSTPRTTTRRPATTTAPRKGGSSVQRPAPTRKPAPSSRKPNKPSKPSKPKSSDKDKQVASVPRKAYPRAGSTSTEDRPTVSSRRQSSSQARVADRPRASSSAKTPRYSRPQAAPRRSTATPGRSQPTRRATASSGRPSSPAARSAGSKSRPSTSRRPTGSSKRSGKGGRSSSRSSSKRSGGKKK